MTAYRTSTQIPLGLHDLVIDNFAGGGGASTGIEAALGRQVDVAINHNEQSVSLHTVNHPHTRHLCESVWDVDPVEVCDGRPVRLAWFSPDCTHFSKAKGGKPVKKEIRGLAWVVLRWAARVRPQVIMLENVEEFKTWGPIKNGQPCPDRKGQTFAKWKAQLLALGYQVEHRELRACDYGAPTIRKRLFIIARCDGQPIVWPAATHGPGKGLKRYRTAADIIDWTIPCPSIFERKRPLADNTLRRIARGIQRFVLDNPQPFIVRLGHYGSGNAKQYRSSEPLTTITSKNEHCLVTPLISTYYGAKSATDVRCSKLDAPIATQTTENRHALVTAFLAQHNRGATGHKADSPLSTITARGTQQNIVTAHMVRQFGQSVGSAVTDPIGTVTAGGAGKTGLVTSHLLKLRGTCKDGQPVTEPAPTITAGGFHVGEVRSFLLKYYGNEKESHGLTGPLHTVTSKERFGLVTVAGENYQIVDIGMRMLSPRELYLAQGFPANYIIDRTADGTPITKTAQVRMCGNSVCPPIAAALVRANVVEQDEEVAA